MIHINELRFQALPPDYRAQYTLGSRALGCTTFIITISVIAFMALCFTAAIWQHLHQTSFIQHLTQVFTQLTLKQGLIGGGIITVLSFGTGLVLWKAKRGDDRLLNGPISHRTNVEAEPIVRAVYEYQAQRHRCYIDKSSLDATGTGKAFLYPLKSPSDHYITSTMVFLTTPIYTAQTMLYHACRIVPIFLFTLGCWVIERFRTDPLFGERKFRLMDVVKQPALSLWHIVKAPFYGLAYMCAMIYSLGDPVKGRILGAKIERDWNEGRCRAQGYWSVRGPQRLWSWTALGPDDLGQFNFFLAGCHQPIGVVEYRNGVVVVGSGKSLSEATRPGSGSTYEIYPEQELRW